MSLGDGPKAGNDFMGLATVIRWMGDLEDIMKEKNSNYISSDPEIA